jgi:hypothetical protein
MIAYAVEVIYRGLTGFCRKMTSAITEASRVLHWPGESSTDAIGPGNTTTSGERWIVSYAA